MAAALLACCAWLIASASGDSRQISAGGTASAQTGAFTPWDGSAGPEFAGSDAEGTPDAYSGIIDRSLSKGAGKGAPGKVGTKTKSNPEVVTAFEGLNHYQQRYTRGGNQFSVEPPDQGLCVGNGYEVEAVNDVLNVFNASGQSVLPDNTATNIVAGFPRDVNHAVDLNSFFGYPPAINRTTGVRGQFVTDPSCIYDAQTDRFFLVVLTLDSQVPGPCQGVFSCVNHLDLAVSKTGNPAGAWNVYRIDVTGDGTSNPDPSNACPCLGDYPHIGADANGIYLTTNSYPWHGNGFNGAQIYALSKAQLAAGSPTVTMQHIDTWGMVNVPSDAGSTQPGFTVWPAQSPGADQFASDNGGTEYFLSSNAADEAKKPVAGSGGDYTSNQIVIWTLSNTSSLNSATPALHLSNQVDTVNQYAIPPHANQPGSGSAPTIHSPQGNCLNDETTPLFNGQTGCWKLLVGATAHAAGAEVVSTPDSNDTRMQQVDYANGKLWGALDTAVSFDNNPADNKAGVAWFVFKPQNGKVVNQGTYGLPDTNLTYPAVGVTASGRGVVAMTAMGADLNPTAAYASLDEKAGMGDTHYVDGSTGASPDDGFTGYRQQEFPNPIRPRWGDYGAAAVDGNNIWIASETTAPQPCDYTAWGGPFFAGGTGDNLLGTCGGASHGAGPRTALANWATWITELNMKGKS